MAPCPHNREECFKREIEELSLLFDISQALSKSSNLKDVIAPVLKVMAERMGLLRGTLTILNRENKEIFIEEAYGLSHKEQLRGRYKTGEGIIGRVIETGKPWIVPLVSEEPNFLNKTLARTSERQEISFICVPIKIGKEVIGSLSVDRLYSPENYLDEDLRLLCIVAPMIAQKVKLHQKEHEEILALTRENRRLQNEINTQPKKGFFNIIGSSKEIKNVFSLIGDVAKSKATVLIRGESGVGKELVAKAIHENSDRKGQPFVKLNCSAFPENLIETELFGHEKGAFTGASTRRRGKFEIANHGTLFLDEIGDFSQTIQVKLLRILQEQEYSRLGGNTLLKSDVRIIAATNRKLEELIKNGDFREDFYYRINVFPIYIPSLRERKTDLPLLINHFIEIMNTKLNKQIKRVSTTAIDLIMSYHWPGNIRELENCIERASLLTTDEVIHAYHLPPTLQISQNSNNKTGDLQEMLDNIEKDIIFDTLKTYNGNMKKAANQLGITERQIGLRVKKYNIHKKHFFRH